MSVTDTHDNDREKEAALRGIISQMMLMYPAPQVRTDEEVGLFVATWTRDLWDYDPQVVRLAFDAIRRDPETKFFPAPGIVFSKIRALMQGDNPHDAEWAWKQAVLLAGETERMREVGDKNGYLDLTPPEFAPVFDQDVIECATAFGLQRILYCNAENALLVLNTRKAWAEAWATQGERREQRALIESASPRVKAMLSGASERMQIEGVNS